MTALNKVFLLEEKYKQLKFPTLYLLTGLSNQQGTGLSLLYMSIDL